MFRLAASISTCLIVGCVGKEITAPVQQAETTSLLSPLALAASTGNPQPGAVSPMPLTYNPQGNSASVHLPEGPVSKSTWYGLNQAQRNAAIAATAIQMYAGSPYSDLRGSKAADAKCKNHPSAVQCDCKEFARAIVIAASGGAATLPATDNGGYGYHYYLTGGGSKQVSVVNGSDTRGSLRSAVPGNVVQLSWPHTMTIVAYHRDSRDSIDGVDVIESNYKAGTVGRRTVLYASFDAAHYHFSIYQVLAGR